MKQPFLLLAIIGWFSLTASVFAAEGVAIDPAKIPGKVLDDTVAKVEGTWTSSVHTKPFLGEGYLYSQGGADQRATFSFDMDEAGAYHVLFSYAPGTNRTTAAKVAIRSGDTDKDYIVNQQRVPEGAWSFHYLGEFSFDAGPAELVVSAEENKKGVVIVDGIAILTADQWKALKAEAEKNQPPKLLAALRPEPNKPDPNKPTKPDKVKPERKDPPKDVAEKAPAFERQKPAKVASRTSSEKLDAAMEKHVGGILNAPLASDEAFFRRLSLDLIGRQPTTTEMATFLADEAMDKRARAVDKLLASPEFGANWADYYSDVVSYRTPQPELTFLNYRPFKNWLAEEFNKNVGWDEVTYKIITASGTVGENPAATYVGFHQGDKSRLASETTRVFLSTQIQCAECHDHKFIDMPQETFHHVAAFFVRVQTKLPWNDSNLIVVSSKNAGEHKMPESNKEMQPAAFSSKLLEPGQSDVIRRTELARWIVNPENPWFAKAYTNRVWARLMGRGFCEPVDEIGDLADSVLPEVHVSLAEHFVATEFDMKDVFRVVANSRAYQRPLRDPSPNEQKPFAVIPAGRLRGDEVFASLKAGIELPNFTPPKAPAAEGVRFPPPPKSTQDLVNEAFGFDPSSEAHNVARTMQQAMFLMNNDQIQKQIDASPGSGTVLARIVSEETDDAKAIGRLYQAVLARKASDKEIEIARKHLTTVGERKAAYEDLLWSMINSAEFLSRR